MLQMQQSDLQMAVYYYWLLLRWGQQQQQKNCGVNSP